ncbi:MULTISPECIES: RCC1 domain-containing protein [Paenibacillus]|uniref:RCC1-like domain-containing protein n=1 Tax=Paenibacillus vandeheii TaxID=3035917 RepID=A0ABT8JFN2_9BACL|nr:MULTISPECIES: hypothetical protein [Paenibacillus]KGP81354.1 hypothetical protein P363_0128070 [Paenibacillus sp. MAEPY1]KGP81990.1 hypothetical protein P364_0114325 [Paenibacillus sp. MAEPY2]MDN4603909.1 hypothetical protein [Paenibacillus vandeheii]
MKKRRFLKGMLSAVIAASMLSGSFIYPDKTSAASSFTGVKAALNYDTTLIQTSDNNWYGTGDNAEYQLATNERTNVLFFNQFGLDNIVDVAYGQDATLAVRSDGRVYAWGQSIGSSRLGNASRNDVNTPQLVEGISDVIQVASGISYSMALKSDGTVWTWGKMYWESEDGTKHIPKQVAGLTDVVQIVAGYRTPYAIKSDGTLWAWGSNDYGQVGNGDRTSVTAPVQVLTNVKKVVSHEFSTLALKNDGTVWGWGKTDYGQTGYGNSSGSILTYATSPHKFGTLNTGEDAQINDVIDIAISSRSSLVVRSDGSVWGAGTSSSGTLADAKENTNPRPVLVNDSLNIKNIYMGSYHAVAIDHEGKVWGWGNSSVGQLGFKQNAVKVPVLLNVANQQLADPTFKVGQVKDNTIDVTITNPDYYTTLILEYRFNGSGWKTINSGDTITLSENGTLEARVTNPQGTSKVGTYLIKGIGSKPAKPEMTAKYSNNEMIILFTSPTSVDELKLEYRFKNGEWTTVNSGETVTFTENGLLEARVTNEYGVSSDINEFTISAIDDSVPAPPTFTLKDTSDKDGTTTLIINWPSDATKRQYRSEGNDYWADYGTSSGIYVQKDTTYYARATNQYGKYSEASYVIDFLYLEDNYASGIGKVFLAEVMKQQVYIDEAREFVANLALKDENRESLNARLDAVQEIVDQNDPTYKQKVQDATDAVIKAETSKTQSDVDAARDKVELIRGTVKDELSARLDAVQTWINGDADYANKLLAAKKAVEDAESILDQFMIDAARASVSELKETDKKDLSDRLDVVQQRLDTFEKALAGVLQAERSLSQTDVDTARQLVSEIRSPADYVNKNLLNERLNNVQTEIDNKYTQQLAEATAAVEKAEQSILQVDVNAALILVKALRPDGIQGNLLIRLGIVQNLIIENYTNQIRSATIATENAEASLLQAEVDTARVLVAVLRDEDQTDLTARLDAVQVIIDTEKEYQVQLTHAVSSVVKAESTKSQEDVDTARGLVEKLRTSDQEALTARLDKIQTEINGDQEYTKQLEEAIEAVNKAESTKDQADLDHARDLVDKLKDKDQVDLSERLDNLQEIIDDSYEQTLKSATEAVEKAETSLLQEDVTAARNLIKALRAYDKATLGTRLDVVQELIDSNKNYQEKLQEAEDAVKKAESTVLQDDLDDARELVNSLLPVDQTAFQSRLDALQNIIDERDKYNNQLAEATNSVRVAELSRNQEDVDVARTQVAELKPEDQSKLNLRLDSVQSIIDFKLNLGPAKEAVFKAEESQLQTDLDTAKGLVDKLREGAWKSYLVEILNDVQLKITTVGESQDAINAAKEKLSAAESSKKQADLTKAKTAIDALPASMEKNALTESLAKLQAEVSLTKAVQNANLAVTRATSAKTWDTYYYALALVNPLPDSSKSDMLTKLEALKTKIDTTRTDDELIMDAETLVEFAETSLLENDYELASVAVGQLKTSSRKTQLNKRITAIKNGLVKQNLKMTRFEVKTQTKNTNTLVWDKVDGATGYKLERMLNGAVLKTYNLTTQSTYKDVGLELNTEYSYRITPKAGSILGEPKEIVASKFVVDLPPVPTLVSASVDEDGVLHVTGTGQDQYTLYYVVHNEKGVQQTRASLVSGEEKTYVFNTAGVYTVKVEAYSTSGKVSSYSEAKTVTVLSSMIEPPVASDVQYSAQVEGDYVVFTASVANNVDGVAQKFTFEVRDPEDKRFTYGVGKLVDDRILYTFKRSASSMIPGEYTLLIKGKRGSTSGEAAEFVFNVN